MSRDEALQLLGGYATGTLTDSERQALFAAALEHQDVFDAIAREEALRETLSDPATRRELLAVLEPPLRTRPWWQWRPLAASLAMAGIALAAVAVWRASHRAPAPVIVAQVEQPRRIEPPPATIAPTPSAVPRPPARTPRREVPKAVAVDLVEKKSAEVAADSALRQNAPAPPNANTAQETNAPQNAAEVQVNVLSGRQQLQQRLQQVGQLSAPLPPPSVQQQQFRPKTDTVEVQAVAPLLDRAARRVQATSLTKEAESKGGFVLQWSILRGDRELPPGTLLDPSETIRLRITSASRGTVTVLEGEKTLASGPVDETRPFETEPLAFTGSGRRLLKLSFQSPTPAMLPLVMEITLTYR